MHEFPRAAVFNVVHPPLGQSDRKTHPALAQALDVFGAALCIFSTYWSIAFLVAIHLQYTVAPRFRPSTRLGIWAVELCATEPLFAHLYAEASSKPASGRRRAEGDLAGKSSAFALAEFEAQ